MKYNKMDPHLESQIISVLEKQIEKSGSYSIKHAAQTVFYDTITLAEQKQIAKQIVRTHHFVTKIKNGEIIVSKNLAYSEGADETKEQFQFLKYLMYAIAGLASYLVFKVFLPGLSH